MILLNVLSVESICVVVAVSKGGCMIYSLDVDCKWRGRMMKNRRVLPEGYEKKVKTRTWKEFTEAEKEECRKKYNLNRRIV